VGFLEHLNKKAADEYEIFTGNRFAIGFFNALRAKCAIRFVRCIEWNYRLPLGKQIEEIGEISGW